MDNVPQTNQDNLFSKIEDILKLPLAEYHKVQLILHQARIALKVDRCWLLYPCQTDAEEYVVPIEDSSQKYPGANRLKAYTLATQVCRNIVELVQTSQDTVVYNLSSGLPKGLANVYSLFNVKSQMACQILVKNKKPWVLGVHSCARKVQYSKQQKQILSQIAQTVTPLLEKLTRISSLVSNIELSSDTLNNNPVAHVIYDLDYKLVYANPAYCRLNKRSLESLFNQHATNNFVKNEGFDLVFKKFFGDILETGSALASGKKITGDGETIYIESTGNLINYNSKPHYIVAVKNTTAETQILESLNNALDIQHAILEATEDGILVEDSSRKIIIINKNFFDLLCLTPSHNQSGLSLDFLAEALPHIIDAEILKNFVLNISTESTEKTTMIFKHVNHKLFELDTSPLIHEEQIKGRVWHFKDITEKHNLTHKLSYQATHDVLTKLMNRRGFDERLKEAILHIESNHSCHALLYLDLDHFKIINDSSGHAAGDMALIEVSQELSQILRQSDTLARVGGDEFCILLQDCTPEAAKVIADKIHACLDRFRFVWEDKIYNLGVSIGIVTLDQTIKSYEAALKLADTSCYLAKEEGRNQVHVHTSSDQAVLHRLQQGNIVNKIQEALRADHFSCYLQKICSTDVDDSGHSCEVTNYEALVRMRGDDGNIIPPDLFLPPAERYNLIYKIDHWVIKNCIPKMASISDKFKWFSINLSGQTIAHEKTYDVIVSTLKNSGLAANKVCFEITETAAITNPQIGIAFLKKLQKLGCKVALDDFGTGLSSYEYLKKLPATILKIDGQFIKNMLEDPLDLAMVKSINEIAHLMGKETIGEFVENKEIFLKLKEIGVDYAQGYYLHKPCDIQTVVDDALNQD